MMAREDGEITYPTAIALNEYGPSLSVTLDDAACRSFEGGW